METRFVLVPTRVFEVCVLLWRHRHFDCFDGLWGPTRAILSSSWRFRADVKANGAFQAFIASIIAGMPMIFITRLIL